MTKEEIQKNSEHWYNKYKDAEKKIEELELELTVEKDLHQEETNLHLHAEEYIKSLEQQIEKMKCCGNCKHFDKLYNRCELTRLKLKSCLCNALDKWELRR